MSCGYDRHGCGTHAHEWSGRGPATTSHAGVGSLDEAGLPMERRYRRPRKPDPELATEDLGARLEQLRPDGPRDRGRDPGARQFRGGRQPRVTVSGARALRAARAATRLSVASPGGTDATADRCLRMSTTTCSGTTSACSTTLQNCLGCDCLDTAANCGHLPLLREAHDGLTDHLIPHAGDGRGSGLPDARSARRFSGTTVVMVKEHREISGLVARLGLFMEDLPSHVDRSSVLALQPAAPPRPAQDAPGRGGAVHPDPREPPDPGRGGRPGASFSTTRTSNRCRPWGRAVAVVPAVPASSHS